MKVLILAGGYGTRIGEETVLKPKPMIEIGEKPILWHIMKTYSNYGYNDFVILLGYKGYYIKEYFANYVLHQNNVTVDLANNKIQLHNNVSEPWTITLLDTGANNLTGGRIKRAQDIIGENPFMVTYGDGVADIDISSLVSFHKLHKKALTMTAVQPEGRFGALDIDSSERVVKFTEKPIGDRSWINGGFFVCDPKVFDFIAGDDIVFEKEPLENLARDNEIMAYKHKGFWKPLDTMRDKTQLEALVKSGMAPWIKW
jgi:glucose-1-phosphate cytidylyltransferase